MSVYLAPQNVPHAIVLTLGNKVVLYCIAINGRNQNACESDWACLLGIFAPGPCSSNLT